jgi:hypothetical protein
MINMLKAKIKRLKRLLNDEFRDPRRSTTITVKLKRMPKPCVKLLAISALRGGNM